MFDNETIIIITEKKRKKKKIVKIVHDYINIETVVYVCVLSTSIYVFITNYRVLLFLPDDYFRILLKQRKKKKTKQKVSNTNNLEK